ncbi:Cytochrome P450 4F8 [Manis pentadactyla]|nr:Cytochrome P450 4F8 [Manis pentadactyla]
MTRRMVSNIQTGINMRNQFQGAFSSNFNTNMIKKSNVKSQVCGVWIHSFAHDPPVAPQPDFNPFFAVGPVYSGVNAVLACNSQFTQKPGAKRA